MESKRATSETTINVFGHLPDGREVHVITLANGRG